MPLKQLQAAVARPGGARPARLRRRPGRGLPVPGHVRRRARHQRQGGADADGRPVRATPRPSSTSRRGPRRSGARRTRCSSPRASSRRRRRSRATGPRSPGSSTTGSTTGCRCSSTRRSTTSASEKKARLSLGRPQAGVGLQHLPEHRAAADADRLARRGGDRGGAHAGRGRLRLLRDDRQGRARRCSPPTTTSSSTRRTRRRRRASTDRLRRAAVLGSPVAHSLSPALHRAAYAALGLAWTYDAVERAARGPRRPAWTGSATELGRAVADDAAQADRAAAAGRGRPAGRRHRRRQHRRAARRPARRATTPTSPGIVAALARGRLRARRAGRRARAAARRRPPRSRRSAELGDRAPVVLVRDPARAGPLLAAAERLGVAPAGRPAGRRRDVLGRAADLVVSTLPAGAADGLAVGARRDAARRGLRALADRARPALARPRRGRRAMLLHQAAEQVELMTGRPAPLEAMRAALA